MAAGAASRVRATNARSSRSVRPSRSRCSLKSMSASGRLDGGGEGRRGAAGARAAVAAAGPQRRQLLRIDQLAAHRRHDAGAAFDERAPGLDRQLAAAELERRPVERPGRVRQAHAGRAGPPAGSPAAQRPASAPDRRRARPGSRSAMPCRASTPPGRACLRASAWPAPAPGPVRAAARVRAACRAPCRRGTSAWRAGPAACRARGRAGARRAAPRASSVSSETAMRPAPAAPPKLRLRRRQRQRELEVVRQRSQRFAAAVDAQAEAPDRAFDVARNAQRPVPGRRARRCRHRAEAQASAPAPTCRAPGRRRTARRRSSRSSGRAGPARRHATQGSASRMSTPSPSHRSTFRSTSTSSAARSRRDGDCRAGASLVERPWPGAVLHGAARNGRRSSAAALSAPLRRGRCATERERELPGERGIAQPAVQAADTHGIRIDADRAVHGRVAEGGSVEPTSRSIGARSSASASTWKRAVRWRASSAPRACNRAPRCLDVEGERPGLGIVLQQPQRPAFDGQRVGEVAGSSRPRAARCSGRSRPALPDSSSSWTKRRVAERTSW